MNSAIVAARSGSEVLEDVDGHLPISSDRSLVSCPGQLRGIPSPEPARSFRSARPSRPQRRCRAPRTAGTRWVTRSAGPFRHCVADPRYQNELRYPDLYGGMQCRRGSDRRVLRAVATCADGLERVIRLLRHCPERRRQPAGCRLRQSAAVAQPHVPSLGGEQSDEAHRSGRVLGRVGRGLD
jgi:hypothetical protein